MRVSVGVMKDYKLKRGSLVARKKPRETPFFFLLFYLSKRTPVKELPQKPTPLVSHSSVAVLPSVDTLRPAPAVAALLNASVSHRGSHRGPRQQHTSLPRRT
jgi:hypothetical protein